MDFTFATGDLMACWIQHQIAHLKHVWPRCGAPASNRTQACEEDLERKWFGEIVVSTEIKSFHDVCHCIAGCKHKDGSLVVIFAESPSHLKTVNYGQHQIEDNHVKFHCQRRV